MRPLDFSFRLSAASYHATHFAETLVKDDLSYDWSYIVFLNQSFDDSREEDEVIYPEDDNRIVCDINEDKVVELLCRDGMVPQWIDVAVAYTQSKITYLSLLCCGRYHSDDSRLYYYQRGTQPFGLKGPLLPKDHKEGKRFRLPTRKDFMERQEKFYGIK